MVRQFHAIVAALIVAMGLVAVPAQAQKHTRSNIVTTAANAGSFKTLIAAAKAAGLAGVLSRRRGLTVFAPTDAAFARLGRRTLRSLLRPENRGKLRAILLYHVVGQRVPSRAIPRGRTHVRTLNGRAVSVRNRHGRIRVNNARVINADVRASNGVIHVINRVLIPR